MKETLFNSFFKSMTATKKYAGCFKNHKINRWLFYEHEQRMLYSRKKRIDLHLPIEEAL